MEQQSAFVVDIGEPGRKLRSPPSRLKKGVKTRRTLTREDLEEKQAHAEQRRKEQEQLMIQRVREAREECIKLDTDVQKLLQQDAKWQCLPGSENVKVMSRSEARQTIKSVAQDFAKISITISNKTDNPGEKVMKEN